MKRPGVILFLLTCVCLQNHVHADGKVFPEQAYPAEVTIPDQRALIHFSNGVQRLVIETRFSGEGTNFCWVVPLPAQPEVDAATSGLFPTLSFLTNPTLRHQVFPLFSGLLVAAILICVLLANSAAREESPGALVFPMVIATALLFHSPAAGIMGLVIIAWGAHRLRGGQTTLVELLVLLSVLSLLAAMLLPALGTARGGIAAAAKVEELDRKPVGIFDVATVTSTNSIAMLHWLNQRGFAASADASNIIQSYVAKGWVFCVAAISREQPLRHTNSIHPLSFTFPTHTPVYPMQLTAVGSRGIRVELYVFGHERAAARHFAVKDCSRTGPRNDEFPLRHPELEQWRRNSSVVTKLTADLSPSQMREDVQIRFEPFRPHQEVVYSRRGAFTTAANWTSVLMFGTLLGLCVVSALREDPMPLNRIVAAAGAWIPLALIIYLALPTVPVTTGSLLRARALQQMRFMQLEALVHFEDSKPSTLEEARALVRTLPHKLNPFTGQPVREEDSPGNYVIRGTTNGFEFVWFDATGAEQVIPR